MSSVIQQARSGFRTALAVGGLIALAAGILILVAPTKTAMVVTAMLGIYAFIVGLYYIGAALADRESCFWGHVGEALMGVLYIIAGIIFFSNLSMALAALEIMVPIMIGAIWLVQGVVALTEAGSTGSVGWTIFYGIISILAGIALMFAPVLYAGLLWWFAGISLIILGVVQLIRSFQV